MTHTTRTRLGLGMFFAGLMILGALSTGLVAAATTYSVTFNEVGVPSGTAWSLYFNGVTYSPTATSLTITGLSSGSYYWYFSTVAGTTGVQYAPTGLTGAYMTVPTQTTQTLVYQKQFSVAFSVTPPGSGFTNPPYTTWVNAGGSVPITASHYTGYSFLSWSVPKSVGTVNSTKSAATLLTVKGTGTVTANLKTLSTSGTFYETGLPSGTTWTVFFGGATYSSSTTSVAVGSHPPGSESWTISPVSGSTGVEYVASPATGSMDMPYLGAQTVIFTKEDQLTFAVTPSGGGSTAPTTGYFPDGVALPITAATSTGYKFTSWSSSSSSATFANSSHSSTSVTATGPSTITAHFATGTTCTKCTATFYETGLPAGTTWDVSVGGTTYYSTGSSIVLTGLTAAFGFSVANPIAGPPGTSYQPAPVSSYFNIPYQNSVTLQYGTYYQVTLAQSPTYSGTTNPYYGAWYLAGSSFPLTATGTDLWAFKSWSSSTKKLTLSSKTAADTDVTVGAAGTITSNFVSPVKTETFVQTGLPAGTTWSIVFDGLTYFSGGWDLNVTGVATSTSHYWNIPGPVAGSSYGVQYAAWTTASSVQVAYTTSFELMFVQQVQVGFIAGGTTGGTVYPSTTQYYNVGTLLAIDAYNSSTVHFKSWSSTGGPLTIGQTTWATTTVLIGGPGNVTAAFK